MKRMFNLILIISIVLVQGCKKKTVEPAPVEEPCKTKTSEVFTGKYVTVGTLYKDTITISYTSTDCYSSDVNLYKVEGLYKAVSDYSSTTLENRDYAIFSSEANKYANQQQFSISFGMYTWGGNTMLTFQCTAPNTINMTFQKVP